MTPAELAKVAAFLGYGFECDGTIIVINADGILHLSDADLIVAMLEEFARRGKYPNLWYAQKRKRWGLSLNLSDDADGEGPTIRAALVAAVPEA